MLLRLRCLPRWTWPVCSRASARAPCTICAPSSATLVTTTRYDPTCLFVPVVSHTVQLSRVQTFSETITMSPCQDCWSEDVLVQRLEVLFLDRTLKEACESPYSTALQSFLGVFEVDGLQLKNSECSESVA